MRQSQNKVCYACNAALFKGAVTQDHIPPKCLFPKSTRDDNLISVPCCRACNSSHAGDDAVLMLLASHIAANHHAAEILNKIDRCFSALSPVFKRLFTSNWDILAGMSTDENEISIRIPVGGGKTMIRIVKGLFFHIKGFDDYHSFEFGFKQLDAAQVKLLRSELGDPSHSIRKGAGVFRADHITEGNRRNFGLWMLEFYEAIFFCVPYRRRNLSQEGRKLTAFGTRDVV